MPKIIYPEPTDDLKAGFSWRSLRYFGAGAIIASVTIGSGETVFASRSGAIFGYKLLWCFAAAAVMKGIQVYTAGRYFTLTGEHPMTHWALLPGPRNWVPITIGVLSLLCFPFWQAGLPLILGNVLNWIFAIQGRPEQVLLHARLWGTAAIVVAVGLTLLRGYGFLEKAQTLIVGVLIGCLMVAVVAARPDWLAALHGTLVPCVPQYDQWVVETYESIARRPPWVEVATCLGAVGGGTYDYLGYIGCFREKSWGAIGLAHGRYEIAVTLPPGPLPIDTSQQNLLRARQWLLPAKVDTAAGFFCVFLLSICFVILGAVFLQPQHKVPDQNNLLNYQAQFLTALHPSLLYVYKLGIFMAFFGTIYGGYEVYFRTAFECLMPVSSRVRRIRPEKLRVGIVLYCAAFALLFLWTMRDPIKIVTPAAIVGGVFTCGLWCLAMIWADRRFLPKPLRMGHGLLALTAISGVVLTTLGMKSIWDYIGGLF